MVSSCSHPPLGRIHSGLPRADTNKILPPRKIGTQPVTNRMRLFELLLLVLEHVVVDVVVDSWTHRCVERPCRLVFRLEILALSLSEVVRSNCGVVVIRVVVIVVGTPLSTSELVPASLSRVQVDDEEDTYMASVAAVSENGLVVLLLLLGGGRGGSLQWLFLLLLLLLWEKPGGSSTKERANKLDADMALSRKV